MGIFTKLRRRLARPRRLAEGMHPARCIGCGRPVSAHNTVCRMCTSDVERDHGG